MMKKIFLLTFVCLLAQLAALGKPYVLFSPDRSISIRVGVSSGLNWSVSRGSETLLSQSSMSLLLGDGRRLGKRPVVLRSENLSVNGTITAVVPVKNRYIPDRYNALLLHFKGGYSVEFRAYDNGVAYRFLTSLGSGTVEVSDEEVLLNFAGDFQAYLPKVDDPEFQGHYEAEFNEVKLSGISKATYGYLPIYISNEGGTKMVLSESDLSDYPNLFLFGTGGKGLRGAFPKVVLKTRNTGNIHLDEVITEKASYHARTTGNRSYPWRILAISSNDKGLLENELVYQLGPKNVLKDTGWIRPGKVAWDWWNANNIYGVDFRSGVNTATYKYYIDFASAYGLEYIVLDEGWSSSSSEILSASKDIDLSELIRYGREKNVGIILWTLWLPMDRDMENVLSQYEKWGIKGVKVDFMARADQYMVNFYDRVAAATARYHLLLDLHGAFKPVGLNRKYPNLLNYEGVKGLEQSKWSDVASPVHNTVLPFTRMVAGPMDYTPGAMLNSNKGGFAINFDAPMSMGTRAHQAAMYVVYEAPLQMLSDNPSNYLKEPLYTKFISRMPTTWDKTIALEGKIGNYVLLARKNGEKWYIGGMCDWQGRSFSVPLSFLDAGKYRIEILKDGVNVDRQPSDYQLLSGQVKKGDVLTVDMAAGGGYTAILTPIQ